MTGGPEIPLDGGMEGAGSALLKLVGGGTGVGLLKLGGGGTGVGLLKLGGGGSFFASSPDMGNTPITAIRRVEPDSLIWQTSLHFS